MSGATPSLAIAVLCASVGEALAVKRRCDAEIYVLADSENLFVARFIARGGADHPNRARRRARDAAFRDDGASGDGCYRLIGSDGEPTSPLSSRPSAQRAEPGSRAKELSVRRNGPFV